MSNLILINEKDDTLNLKTNLELYSHTVFSRTAAEPETTGREDTLLVILQTEHPEKIGQLISQLPRSQNWEYLPLIIVAPGSRSTGLFPSFKHYPISDFISSTSGELVAWKIDRYLKGLLTSKNLNPLTGLPGNLLIQQEIEKIILKSTGQTLVYLDLSNFKAYNDHYGFFSGDIVIKNLARILLQQARTETFIGHIGGDDFVLILPEEKTKITVEQIITSFEQEREKFYQPLDYQRECIISFDREGNRQKFPLLGLSVVSLSLQPDRFQRPEEIAELAGLLKHLAKQKTQGTGRSIHLTEQVLNLKLNSYSLDRMAENPKISLPLRRAVIESIGEKQEKQYEDFLINLLQKDLPEMLKKSTLYALGRLRSYKAIPLLLEYLQDVNPHLRTRAVESLGEIGQPQVRPEIVKTLNDENKYVARVAALTLGKLQDKQAIPFLLPHLNSADQQLRLNILTGLSQLQSPEIAPQIIKLLDDPHPLIRQKAIRILGEIGTAEIIPTLVNLLPQEVTLVREEISLVLAKRIGQKSLTAGDKEFLTNSSEVIIKNSFDSSAAVRKNLLGVLCFLNTKEARKRLIEMLDDPEETVRAEAVRTLGQEPYLYYLISKLKDKSREVRLAAARTLGEIGSEKSVEALRLALKDEDPTLRQACAGSILNILQSHSSI